jgi:hypothetical protein
MKIEYFAVIIGRTDPYEGRFIGNEILGRFQSKQEAIVFKKKWEDEHQKWDPYGIKYLNHRDRKTGRIHFNIEIKKGVFEL